MVVLAFRLSPRDTAGPRGIITFDDPALGLPGAAGFTVRTHFTRRDYKPSRTAIPWYADSVLTADKPPGHSSTTKPIRSGDKSQGSGRRSAEGPGVDEDVT
jgi:hypothetical protein